MTRRELPPVVPPIIEEDPTSVTQKVVGEVAVEKAGEEYWEDLTYSLPDELRGYWDSKLRPLVETGEVSNADACRMIQEAIVQRGKIAGSYIRHPEHEGDGEKENSDIFQRLMETQTLDNEIGSGKVAKVYTVEGAVEFCVKVVWDQDAYKKENTVSQESYFLEELSPLTVAGVRTPKYVDFFSSLQMNAILMERIDGASLDKIMAGEADFPDDFSLDDFFRRLEEYFEVLHSRNIFHMDIAPRNIMVERKTGLPVVIDFGKSDHFDFSEEVGENKVETDHKGLRDAKKEVRGYLETGVRKQLLAELDRRNKF